MDEKEKNKIYLKIYEASKKDLEELSDTYNLSYNQISLYRTKLVALYALLSEEVSFLEQHRPIKWLEIKKTIKNEKEKYVSDKVADTIFDATEKGQRRIELKFHMKALEQMINALASRMRYFEQEARNEGFQI